ncbi:MAG: hypothetical protein F4Y20_06635 [Acidobacteria bacterium]|nr:hypothetical protein [Acidobacteriota bacterium]MYB32187.1 hypothetical protein [Acidobacteriota bacterium]MYE43290.1 hypothetical protein [Acidobacteriota bacterium]MYH21827.1 hypothetical protein [Acidobacteriota bacterium]MYI39214.1 hypothetical protein [Acidobacteriota bacterium]
MAVLSLNPGAFRHIADAPRTFQSLLVALLGIALVGSVATLGAFLTLVYPLLVLGWLTFHSALSRLFTQLFVKEPPAGGLPSYADWIRSQYFTLSPWIFGIVPLVGTFAWIYSIVLEVRSIMDMGGCRAGRGIVIYLVTGIVRALLFGLVVAIFGAGILSIFALDSLLPW